MGAPLVLFLFLFLSSQLCSTHGKEANGEDQIYVVYMGDVPSTGTPTIDVHHKMLLSVFEDKIAATDSIVHSYGQSFNAFAAKLQPEQVEKIRGMHGVVSVFPNKLRKLLTTRSYDYIGLTHNVNRNLKMESDVIIGLLDTGISVDSPSFNDKGLGPPPAKWKGSCQKIGSFPGCNNKVIGARHFSIGTSPDEDLSPADFIGHGTHTASTVAGVAVERVSLYGIANGTARGAVPAARLAMYKVCRSKGCPDIEILAGFDAAIADGVDILSISLGGGSSDFFADAVAIGAFHASKKGIFVSAAAGNDGPAPGTVNNNAPWLLTVGASSTDRRFVTDVGLGNGDILEGVSINTFAPTRQMHPLITGSRAANHSAENDFSHAKNCDYGTLDVNKVKGKIVACSAGGLGGEDEAVHAAGGYGVLISQSTIDNDAFSFQIPAATIDAHKSLAILKYINSTKNPLAVIEKTRTVRAIGKRPFVASFSSRGPSMLESLRLLKPDVVAPGVDILAAYSPATTVTEVPEDTRHVRYNIMSGTSMACPHAAGVAAYIKSFHPDWSPAAIKSALITTANNNLEPDALGPFTSGAGLINPMAAVHPGLVYDADTQEYIDFLCKEGYSGIRLATLTGDENINCSKLGQLSSSVDGINYPTMQYLVERRDRPFNAVFQRRVTNVGPSKTVYKAQVKASGFNITVFPNILEFSSAVKQRTFKVVIRGPALGNGAKLLAGEIVWTDSIHKVRSPIVVHAGGF